MNNFHQFDLAKGNNLRSGAGFLLVLAGAALFLDRFLNTGWISYAILPVAGLVTVNWGIRQRNQYLLLTAGLILGIGMGIAAVANSVWVQSSLVVHIGLFSFSLGIGWLIIVASTHLIHKPLWWCVVPTGILLGLGYSLSFSEYHWTRLVLHVGLGTGFALLVWGLAMRLIGLVIPGCLLISTGLGIFFAWNKPEVGNPLVHTGIMLVWFSFGWALITLSGRFLVRKFIWWPLIPGGILAMVGCGLYIGGDPGNALNFISNTGSIGLMIFGLYLLLMRKGIHH